MLIPLVTLAILSIVGGFIGWYRNLYFGRRVVREIFRTGIRRQSCCASCTNTDTAWKYFLMGLSVVTAIAGISVAYRMYVTAAGAFGSNVYHVCRAPAPGFAATSITSTNSMMPFL